jgi:hypothetical protein
LDQQWHQALAYGAKADEKEAGGLGFQGGEIRRAGLLERGEIFREPVCCGFFVISEWSEQLYLKKMSIKVFFQSI